MNKRKVTFLSAVLIFITAFSINSGIFARADEEYFYLGGIPVGFSLQTGGATVVGVSDIVTTEGVYSPSKNADIKVGDVILSVNGKEVTDSASIANALKDCEGNPVEVKIERDGLFITKYVTPRIDYDGTYKLGLFLRDNLSGIGTLTYITSDGKYGSLGHPITDDDGKLLEIKGGTTYLCSIIGVVRGERGKAGELKGIFIEDRKIGNVTVNNETGVYGEVDKSYDYGKLEKVKVGRASVGKATVYTCADGVSPSVYDISIVKIDDNNAENKNYVIKIDDKKLLALTGGILQGMSGSPIVQSGNVVGAVTHVFINDPTRGYGINIEKMVANT
ncbi:MAG TPA: SpoIVB peptidase [Clostridiales bacterium]|nr:SpoIVB peptidase [Clostridiales bacterium]